MAPFSGSIIIIDSWTTAFKPFSFNWMNNVVVCVYECGSARTTYTWIEYQIEYIFGRWNGISAMPTIFSLNERVDEQLAPAPTIFKKHFIRTENKENHFAACVCAKSMQMSSVRFSRREKINSLLLFSNPFFYYYLSARSRTYCQFVQCGGVHTLHCRVLNAKSISSQHRRAG